jgi:CHAT domain-containing protein/predicted negative regulator of RcsB-dependent stress response
MGLFNVGAAGTALRAHAALLVLMAASQLAAVATARAAESSAAQAEQQLDLGQLWSLADTRLAQGQINEAEQILRAAVSRSETPQAQASTAMRLGAVLTAGGRISQAREQLDAAAAQSTLLSAEERVRLLEARGNLAVRSGDLLTAERQFEQAVQAARDARLPVVQVRERINLLRAKLERKNIARLEAELQQLHAQVLDLPRSDETALLLLAAADLHRTAVRDFRSPTVLRAGAFNELSRAIEYAETESTRAYAHGFLGALYEDEGRWNEALQLTEQAIFWAQSARAADQLYRWEWQAARLQKQRGQLDRSQQSMDRAVTEVIAVRSDVLQSSRRAYATLIEPLFLDYADINLQQAARLPQGSEEQQSLLRNVRNQLESLKQAEVQDYFENQCAVNPRDVRRGFDVQRAAVVYPILLKNRIEVLIETGGMLRRFSAPVPGGEATQTTRRLRLALEQSSSGDTFMAPAQSLYRWLVKDAEAWLAESQVDTLVFIPSGALRTIPLGALHDGQNFLIERYAVATTPAISLVDSLDSSQFKRLLVGGLTQSVQGFSTLPSVAQELRTVSTFFPARPLQDETFNQSAVESQLASTEFSAAHLATHGEFSSDHRQSFILTYDSRLTMDELRNTLGKRASSLDLLVLSACRTAAGDDRAALGLAGVAVQAGAKSALASLWYINDQATSELMSGFYRGLKAGTMTKAQSLRQAQLQLLRTGQYRHPSYWAPYLLIGNWL